MRDSNFPAFHAGRFLQVIGKVLEVIHAGRQHVRQFGIEQQLAIRGLAPRELHDHPDGGQWGAHFMCEGSHRLAAVILFGEQVVNFQLGMTFFPRQ